MPAPLRFLLLLALFAFALLGAGVLPIHVGAFSRGAPGGAPDGREPMQLGDARPTTYRLVRFGGEVVLRAEAAGAASGLVRRIGADADRYPVLRWCWRVDGVLPAADLGSKDGDDAPARVFVTFDYDPGRLSIGERVKYEPLRATGHEVPLRALAYVWASEPDARPSRSLYTDWVHLVPLRRGAAGVGTWQTERRDIAADYRRAFGEDPPPVSGVAVMTDADDTGGIAGAHYGDLFLSAE